MSRAENQAKSTLHDACCDPGEIIPPIRIDQLPGMSRYMEPIYHPRIVSVQLELSRPRSVGFEHPFLILRLKIDQTRAVGAIGEAVPLGRNNRCMISILPHANDARVFIQCKGEIRLASKPGTFENNLWTTFNNHRRYPKGALRLLECRKRSGWTFPTQNFFVLSEPR